ncbi:hypothetical protein [Methylobacter tundripaludum]|uniref:hypothetical protein n=1 Tax=Methylobacter tundripaludum TaxID=173365 RepID=UPI00058FE3FB|nr:hypothetical protein [Methylobacter tundripaludum]
MTKPKETTRIVFLDYLRVFAFISVLIGHKFTVDIATAMGNDKLHATQNYGSSRFRGVMTAYRYLDAEL